MGSLESDIIMLCEQLSDMNGFEVCKQIKAIKGSVSKIIMVTGDGFNLNVSQAREAGADDYAVKTPGNKYLMQAIRSYLMSAPDNSEHTKIPSGPRVKLSPQGVYAITSSFVAKNDE